jgi:uncharacterized protein (DUF983 family)
MLPPVRPLRIAHPPRPVQHRPASLGGSHKEESTREDAAMTTETPAVSPLFAGLAARCPRCGRGTLLKNGLELRERCTACNLDYKFVDTGDGPAVFAIFVLGFLILGGALYVEFTYEPPVWVHIVLWGVATPLVGFFLLRFLKALLIALQFRNKAEEGRLSTKP